MVFDVLRALGRRWYVVVIGLLLTAGLVFGAYRASPPEYNARALVLLLPPRADVGKGGNPFLLLSGLEQPAGILAAYFSSANARSDVEAISPTAEYEVGIDDSTRGPVIAIDVTDESPADTLRVLSYLLDQIPGELARLQEEVDTRGDAVVGSMALAVDRKAEPDIRGTIRLMIAALVVGVVGTGFSAVALDGFLLRRRQRSGERQSTRRRTPTTIGCPRRASCPRGRSPPRPRSAATPRPRTSAGSRSPPMLRSPWAGPSRPPRTRGARGGVGRRVHSRGAGGGGRGVRSRERRSAVPGRAGGGGVRFQVLPLVVVRYGP